MRKNPYLSVIYDPHDKPLTDYPVIFATYLRNRLKLTMGQSLLDAGCGRAEMLNAFIQLGLDCYGCDLEKPPEGTTAAAIEVVDFKNERLPYADNSFDVVLSKSVVEHFPDPDNYIKDIYRVLKPNGVLILLTPDWESQMKLFYEDHTHVHPYLPLGVERMLRLHGFKDVTAERFCHYPAMWRSRLCRFCGAVLRLILNAPNARQLTRITGIKFFRWSVELQILGIGRK